MNDKVYAGYFWGGPQDGSFMVSKERTLRMALEEYSCLKEEGPSSPFEVAFRYGTYVHNGHKWIWQGENLH